MALTHSTSPDLLTQVFTNDTWLRERRLGPENILEYFSLSPFYDRESVNERVRLQLLDEETASKQTGTLFCLRRTGLEDRGLFVIERALRRSPTDAVLVALYYCIQGRIFQCPDVYAVCEARICSAAFHLRRAMEILGSSAERFTGESPPAAVAASTGAFLTDLHLLLQM